MSFPARLGRRFGTCTPGPAVIFPRLHIWGLTGFYSAVTFICVQRPKPPTIEQSSALVTRFDAAGDGPNVSRETVRRYDFSPIGAIRQTPQGFLKFDANLSRVGVLTYKKADGTTQRELRPPDEVFDSASIETLAGAPVTDLHGGMISPANVRSLSCGIVGETVKHDERFVQGQVTIQDQGLIDKINSGERKEGSPGYQCRLDWTPGSWNGERYDAIQRGIRYNHWALGPKNWNRQGSDVALRLDGNDAASYLEDPPNAGRQPPAGKPKETEIMKIRIDQIEYELDSDAARQAIGKALERRDGTIASLTKERDGLQGKFDASEKELGEQKKKLDEANDPKRVDALVNDRADLIASCRKVLGDEEKLDGLTPRQMRVKVLQKIDEKFDDKDKTDDYVDGVFDQSVKNHEPERREDGLSTARRATPTPGPKDGDKGKGDGKGQERIDEYDVVGAEQRMLERNRGAWREGLDN